MPILRLFLTACIVMSLTLAAQAQFKKKDKKKKNKTSEKVDKNATTPLIPEGEEELSEEDVYYEQPIEFTRESPLTLDLKEEEEEEEVELKKKKRKKNVFYGIKTKKRYTKQGYGEKTTLELFHVLKVYQKPDPYIRDVYWLDERQRKIKKGGKFDEKYGRILHGPYVKRRGAQILEQGIYYLGTKHGRWVKLDKDDILVDKQKYIKGWPKESEITYYDQERTKLKEVIPIEYGEKEGYYYYFFENGLLAVRGEYQFGCKVGRWTENHYNTLQRKKVIQYSKKAYDEEFEPYTWKEWSRRGKLVYDHKKDKK